MKSLIIIMNTSLARAKFTQVKNANKEMLMKIDPDRAGRFPDAYTADLEFLDTEEIIVEDTNYKDSLSDDSSSSSASSSKCSMAQYLSKKFANFQENKRSTYQLTNGTLCQT